MLKYIQIKDEVIIDLHVILQYGIKISVVAENIIEKVKFNVENLTGLKSKKNKCICTRN